MFCVYLITNTVNGKQYVGQTELTPEQRLQNHFYSRNKKDYFHSAIRKYGLPSFVVEKLDEHDSQEETDYAEVFWIDHLGTYNSEIGYNTTYGGRYGSRPNEATKKKIGQASLGRKHSDETKQKMSEGRTGEKNSFYGKQHDPKTIEEMKSKLRISLGGENNPWYGKTLTPEHRSNISKAKMGKKLPPRSEETRKKLSESATKRWAKQRESVAA